jgi:Helix-turn-helix domain
MSSKKVSVVRLVAQSASKKPHVVPSPPEPLFVDIQEAARILGFAVWAVRNLVWDRKIRYVKRGRKYFFSPADLRSYADKLLAESEVA